LLTGAAELIATDGVLDPRALATIGQAESPRWRGVKMGLFMLMLMIVLAPVLGLISRFAFNMIPWPMGVVVFLLGGGGLLRIAYALMFESRSPGSRTGSANVLPGQQSRQELNAGDRTNYIPPEPITPGRWNTNDLEPRSVTDATTQLLEKEQD
jgi:hypothetical protein